MRIYMPQDIQDYIYRPTYLLHLFFNFIDVLHLIDIWMCNKALDETHLAMEMELWRLISPLSISIGFPLLPRRGGVSCYRWNFRNLCAQPSGMNITPRQSCHLADPRHHTQGKVGCKHLSSFPFFILWPSFIGAANGLPVMHLNPLFTFKREKKQCGGLEKTPNILDTAVVGLFWGGVKMSGKLFEFWRPFCLDQNSNNLTYILTPPQNSPSTAVGVALRIS